MEYQEAANLRKKGLFSSITDKLVQGQGVGSSIKSAISEKTAAKVKGFKQAFDPLNLAKKITFGSNLAPALLGRITKRKKEDVEFFTGRSNKVKGLSAEQNKESFVEVLGLIYRLMVRIDEEKQLELQLNKNQLEETESEEQKRNDELIAALTGKRKTKKSTKKDTKPDKKKTDKKEKSNNKTSTKVETTIKKKGLFGNIMPAVVPVAATAAAIGGAAILGTAGISAAAAISIKGETGKTATSKKDILNKAGQVVPNDPKPGVTSYGIFGMNSGAGTVQQFIAENPQFGITAKPATAEFDKQWKDVANQRGEEFLDAQLVWHDKHILNPLRKDLSNKLPQGVQLNEQILAYMADRRIQYGEVQEKSALQYASGATTPSEWIQKMTEYDLANIGTAFSTSLKQHPNSAKGLINRLKMRKDMAMSISPNTDGNQIELASKENKDLKKSAELDQPVIVQKQSNNNMMVSNNKVTGKNKPKEDDRPPYLIKIEQS